MTNNLTKHAQFLVFSLFLGLFFSCTKELDFDQTKDLTLEPVLTSNFVFFNAPATKFSINNTEINTVKDSVIIDFFRSDIVVNRVVKLEFVTEVTNSIDRSFNVQVDFFDANDLIRHSFAVTALGSSANLDVITTHTEVFENQSLDNLKATHKIVITTQALSGGVPLNDSTPGRIHLKSKGILYFEIDTSE